MEKARGFRAGEDETVIPRVLRGESPSFRNFRDLYFAPNEVDPQQEQAESGDGKTGKGKGKNKGKGKRNRNQAQEEARKNASTSLQESVAEADLEEGGRENQEDAEIEEVAKKSKTE